jgi:hypothetical protein
MKEIHTAQGFAYELPDFSKPEFIIRSVIENSNGIEAGLFLRKTAEAYLLMQPMTRREGIGRLLIFDREITPMAKQEDLTDVNCWLPPEIERDFGKLLLHLGWQKQFWSSYSRKVK